METNEKRFSNRNKIIDVAKSGAANLLRIGCPSHGALVAACEPNIT
jgi:hypothetical protein